MLAYYYRRGAPSACFWKQALYARSWRDHAMLLSTDHYYYYYLQAMRCGFVLMVKEPSCKNKWAPGFYQCPLLSTSCVCLLSLFKTIVEFQSWGDGQSAGTGWIIIIFFFCAHCESETPDVTDAVLKDGLLSLNTDTLPFSNQILLGCKIISACPLPLVKSPVWFIVLLPLREAADGKTED